MQNEFNICPQISEKAKEKFDKEGPVIIDLINGKF